MEPPTLQVELDESANATLDRCREARPANTIRAYAPKQREFRAWCERKGFHETTRYQVTAAKLHLFLQEDVVDREVRVKNSTRKVGVATVEMYVNAVSDMYSDQQSRGANSHPHPRNSLIKALLTSLKREKHTKNKREYVDRGVGSLLDGYCTTDDLIAISRYYMNLNTGSDLRNRLSHFLCHACLLRGESARNLELPDLFSVVLEHEGFSDCRALVMIMEQGKTNQYGRREFGSCIRHRNVEVCPVGALGLYLFYRWSIKNEAIPNFLEPEQWYDIKVLKSGKGMTTALTYRAHYDATVKAFTALGMHSKAKTHAARGSGSRMAELAGASESQIRRLGRWNAGAMEGCYLTALPRDAMRSLAGFSPDRRSFYLERAALVPPDSLQREVFPFVENYMTAYTKQSAPHVATGGFLNLLSYLRVVVLQDAVLLRELHPAHKLWGHPLFRTNAFTEFSEALKAKMLVDQSPQTMRLNEVVPDLMDHLKQQHQQTLAHIDSKLGEVGVSFQDLTGSFHQLTSGAAAVRLSVDWGNTAPSQSATQSPASRPTLPATYKMVRALKTVHQVWQEWAVGIHGDPAVRDLEEQHNSSWRNTAAEKRFFFRRKRIIDRVISIAQQENVSHEQAVCILEATRAQADLTLNALTESLTRRA
ncbi:hypothetical protein PR001_g29185 [Phytophthora rubi]|uniref:Ndc10 domain-containing protein n=1 Tax=Phytophthora rubi TaxID=129364 RepID=A0A6A3H5K0_9STRA|nr:hypothetical protein PR001_g29185 [Phytophthora rubi]